MKPISYMVSFKDNPHSQTLHFGPFASVEKSDEFINELPTPRQGGFKRRSIVQPYMHSDMSVIRRLILASREQFVRV